MKKKYSIKERYLFSRVFAKGRSTAHGDVIVHCLRDFPNPRRRKNPKTTPRTRFGLAVPNKLGGAVQRNRAKRLMREALRALRPQIAGGWLIIVTARPSVVAPDCRMQRVRTNLRRALEQLQLIAPSTGAK